MVICLSDFEICCVQVKIQRSRGHSNQQGWLNIHSIIHGKMPIGHLEFTVGNLTWGWCKEGIEYGVHPWHKLAWEIKLLWKRTGTKQRGIYICFVRAGQKSQTSQGHSSLLDETALWEMRLDLRRRLIFPVVVQTTHRPDIIMWSQQCQKTILIELTVPCDLWWGSWEEVCQADWAVQAEGMEHLDVPSGSWCQRVPSAASLETSRELDWRVPRAKQLLRP